MTYRFRWLLASALAASAAPALAQNAAADGAATIIDQFSVTKDSDLLFGTIVLPSSGSNTITIAPSNGDRSLSGAGNATTVGAGNARAAFTVAGDGGQGFTITVPTSFSLERSGGSETISVSLTGSASGGTTSGTPGNPGTATFGVGGSFLVDSATLPGVYEGNFTVTVDNN